MLGKLKTKKAELRKTSKIEEKERQDNNSNTENSEDEKQSEFLLSKKELPELSKKDQGYSITKKGAYEMEKEELKNKKNKC